jgi:hypothetical protein
MRIPEEINDKDGEEHPEEGWQLDGKGGKNNGKNRGRRDKRKPFRGNGEGGAVYFHYNLNGYPATSSRTECESGL